MRQELFRQNDTYWSGGSGVSWMVPWSAPNVSNSIFVIGNAPRGVRIDALVASGGRFEGNFALPKRQFEEIPCVETTLNKSSQTSFFNFEGNRCRG